MLNSGTIIENLLYKMDIVIRTLFAFIYVQERSAPTSRGRQPLFTEENRVERYN